MSEIKLLRCPFCGGEAELLKGQCEIDNYVMCLECRSKTKLYNTKASAIKAWNTRKPMQNIVERLEEEYHEIDKSKKESYENGDWERFDMFTNLNRGIYKAIAIVNTIVKEEGGIDE